MIDDVAQPTAPAGETVEQLEAKLKAIKEQQYPADLEALAQAVKEKAAFYKKTPREVLADLGKKFQTKKFVSLEQKA